MSTTLVHDPEHKRKEDVNMNRENDSYSSVPCKSAQKLTQKWDDAAVQPTSDRKLLLSIEPLGRFEYGSSTFFTLVVSFG